jgi:hypothetical protein
VQQLMSKEVHIKLDICLQEPMRVVLQNIVPTTPKLTMPFHPLEYLTINQLLKHLKDLITNHDQCFFDHWCDENH